ncbi:hypothetical protein D3C78_1944240 [compost metagenome]
MAPQIQELGQLLIHDRIKNDARFLVDQIHHLGELLLVPDHRINMFHRHRSVELRRDGTTGRHESLSG